MKKYQGKSANQILKASTICEMSGGEYQLMYEGMIVIASDCYSMIHLHSLGGVVASVECGRRAAALAEQLSEAVERKYVD